MILIKKADVGPHCMLTCISEYHETYGFELIFMQL